MGNTQIAVYTAICGGKDAPRTDIEVFDFYPFMVLPVHQAKIFKVLSHQFQEDADYSVWLDGNIKLVVDPEELVANWLQSDCILRKEWEMAVFRHPCRDCIYEEEKAIRHYYGKLPFVMEQVEYYRSKGHPEHWGMAECNVIVRKHTDAVKRFNDAWWSEICRWSWRDQLSFPFVLRKMPDLRVNWIDGHARNHRYFQVSNHLH